jgi:hypothetical protein
MLACRKTVLHKCILVVIIDCTDVDGIEGGWEHPAKVARHDRLPSLFLPPSFSTSA